MEEGSPTPPKGGLQGSGVKGETPDCRLWRISKAPEAMRRPSGNLWGGVSIC